MEPKLGRLINAGLLLFTMLAGSRSDTRSMSVDGESDTRTVPVIQEIEESSSYEIEIRLTNGGVLYCRDNNPVGLQYSPPGSPTGSGPGSCDAFYARDQVIAITVNDQPVIIPSASSGIIPSTLVGSK